MIGDRNRLASFGVFDTGGLPRIMAAGNCGLSVACGDLDRNGKPDLVTGAGKEIGILAVTNSGGWALAGVAIAFCNFSLGLQEWMDHSRQMAGTWLDRNETVLLIFAGLMAVLVLVGAEKLMKPSARPDVRG